MNEQALSLLLEDENGNVVSAKELMSLDLNEDIKGFDNSSTIHIMQFSNGDIQAFTLTQEGELEPVENEEVLETIEMTLDALDIGRQHEENKPDEETNE